jgi:hypothetical protein
MIVGSPGPASNGGIPGRRPGGLQGHPAGLEAGLIAEASAADRGPSHDHDISVASTRNRLRLQAMKRRMEYRRRKGLSTRLLKSCSHVSD